MPAQSFAPSKAVRVFVAIGAVMTVFSAIVVLRLRSARNNELLRYQACEQGTRQDCSPSLFWLLAGLTTPEAVGTSANSDSQTGKRVTRTSEAAPLLTSLRPEGFSPQGAGYRIEVGTPVDLISTIENAQRVEVRFRAVGESIDASLKAMEAVADQPNTYQAKFTWTETRAGELEIRAYGPQAGEEATSLFVPVTVGPVANPS